MESGNLKEMEELQKAADYYALKNTVKRKAMPNIIWGIINIILGLFFVLATENAVNIVVVFLGVFMLAIGIWAIIAPQLKILLFEAISLWVVGGWNAIATIITFIMMISALNNGSEPPTTVAYFFAIWQIYWAIDVSRAYRRFSELSPKNPGPEMMKKIDQITRSVLETNYNVDTGIIVFNQQDGWTGSVWGARLGRPETYSIFTTARKDDIFFLRPSEIVIHRIGNFRGVLKANFILRGYNFKGTIHPSFLQRFEAWEKTVRNA